jgi:hypothetical protein
MLMPIKEALEHEPRSAAKTAGSAHPGGISSFTLRTSVDASTLGSLARFVMLALR